MDDKDLQTPSRDTGDSLNEIPRNVIMPGAKPSASFNDPVLQGNASYAKPKTETVSINTIPLQRVPVVAPVNQSTQVVEEQPQEIPEIDIEISDSSIDTTPLQESLAEPLAQVAPTSPIPLRDIPVIKPRVTEPPAAVRPEMPKPEAPRLSYVPDNELVTPQSIVPDIEIPTLRTYKNDIGRTVETDKITTAKILLAEQKKQEKQQAYVPDTSVKKPKNIFALLLGLILTVGAFGVIGFFVYTKMMPKTPNVTYNAGSFFLFAFDKEEFIDVAKSKNDIYASVNQIVANGQQAQEKTYTDLIFYKKDTATDKSVRISSTEFFNLYGVQLPTNIARSISKDFVYGLYKTSTAVEPFVVIGLTDFETAFDSMFAWEPTLAIDMKAFFPNLMEIFAENPAVPEVAPVVVATTSTSTKGTATSTATSTQAGTSTVPVVPAYKPINRNVQFTDVVLSNRDTRAIRDENGTPYFYYVFIDRDKILFAQNPDLISDIVRKIREKQLVR